CGPGGRRTAGPHLPFGVRSERESPRRLHSAVSTLRRQAQPLVARCCRDFRLRLAHPSLSHIANWNEMLNLDLIPALLPLTNRELRAEHDQRVGQVRRGLPSTNIPRGFGAQILTVIRYTQRPSNVGPSAGCPN